MVGSSAGERAGSQAAQLAEKHPALIACEISGYGLGGNTGGRGRTGLTDTDSGGNADNAGNGRGATRNSASGISDGDSGSAADRGGYGRGPRRNW